ncbi:hypothetical protein [Enterococcus termitis]|uniref:Uncharacterized protein n=1 Tax=Enterococcus termitis TaxID=332950 RepID=A0A1E5GTY2_9ENTE|nr:hypothetical protein [Enterococcus termitis]OEG16154.1 hypothetical protein BCR25_18335 [Enterococcus termitis]OJG96825.1 hypothetical protein RV18_GL001871 [Enterococcus termitis]
MSRTKFYDFEEEQLIQAKNKKEAIEIGGYSNDDEIPFIEVISEQQALERVSKSVVEGENTPIGFSEAKRIIDENKSRVLLIDSSML